MIINLKDSVVDGWLNHRCSNENRNSCFAHNSYLCLQSTWVHSFDDYVDDFIFFVTSVSRESVPLPLYLVAHSMVNEKMIFPQSFPHILSLLATPLQGGLVAGIAMSRLPTLFNRAILIAPMFRNKCGMKAINYQFPLPQPIAYWITSLSCHVGLGATHALGFFKEKPGDVLRACVTTSDEEQLLHWQQLREAVPQVHACLYLYLFCVMCDVCACVCVSQSPNFTFYSISAFSIHPRLIFQTLVLLKVMSTCVTNDWVFHSIRCAIDPLTP